MSNSVQYVRNLCRKRKIPVSRLEKDCGFSNGYLNPKKITQLPYDRAKQIAEYLNIPVSSILNGEDSQNTVTQKEIMIALFRGREDITDEMFEEVQRYADYVLHREVTKKQSEK